MDLKFDEEFGSIEKLYEAAGKKGYEELKKSLDLSEADVEVLAQLQNHAGHHVLLRIFLTRAASVLDALKYEVEDEKKILAGFRLWQALSQASDDLKFFPKMAREALENRSNLGIADLLEQTEE